MYSNSTTMFTDEQSAPQDVFQTDPSHSNMSSTHVPTTMMAQSSEISPTTLEQPHLSSTEIGEHPHLSTTGIGESTESTGTLFIGDQMISHQASTTGDQADGGHTSRYQDAAAPCLVCGDKGSGYHYSVFSCEGCKGFFKRTVQKFLTYTCKGSGNCNVSKFTRNNCQHCRFQKCLEAGMKKEAVRDDRSPGGKNRNKRQRLEDIPGLISAIDCG